MPKKKERILLLETSIDHLSGEEIGAALNELNHLPQVLDAIFLSGIGKKNRPAGLLQVLCQLESEEMVVDEIFRYTHTLGIRRQEIERYILARKVGKATIAGEVLDAKFYELEKTQYIRPEADALAEYAKKHGIGMPALRYSAKCNNDQ